MNEGGEARWIKSIEEKMKPLGKVKIKWSPEFAYAIGLLTTDGNLSPDMRHIHFTSKDRELVELLKKCLGIKNSIGKKARGLGEEKKYFVIQFGDVLFYRFLVDVGLSPNKSKTLEHVNIPDLYLFDFLRGHLDGDGTFYSYWDPRWRSSFMFYTEFISASKRHIDWLRKSLEQRIGIRGHVTQGGKHITYQLKYAKAESLKLLSKLYYTHDVVCLLRKRRKIEKALKIIGKKL